MSAVRGDQTGTSGGGVVWPDAHWPDDGWEGPRDPGGRLGAAAELVPFSAEPDIPVDLRGVEFLRPGPALTELLACTDPADVADADLVEVIAAYERLSSWIAGRQVAAMAELSRRPVFWSERGRDERAELRNAGCQVAAELKLAQVTGENRVWTARQLVEELPATLVALTDGRIDYRRASAIAEVADRCGVDVARAVEGRVLPKAGRRTLSQHRRAIEWAIIAVDPTGADERHARAATTRRVSCYATEDGMGQVVADLTAEGMAAVRAVLDAAATAMKTADPADPRTIDQRRADALVDMARLSLASGWLGGVPGQLRLASGQGRRPAIQVTVPWSTLIRLDDEPGELGGYGPIPGSVARRIAADGVWRRLLTDPATGALLDYGTTRYEPPADLREFVIARDRTCRGIGCEQPAQRSQLDHTIPFPDGWTSASNLGSSCPTHHGLKTHGGWQLDQPQPGRFVWTSPVGKTYEREPEPIGPITAARSGDP